VDGTESQSTVGREFAEALAAKDFDRIAGELVASEIDFKALTPSRAWEVSSAAALVTEVFNSWLEEDDHVDELVAVETGEFADCQTLAYTMRVHNEEDGQCVFEQRAYFTESDGRIDWMRVVCSGWRPA
jgi:hypothetical protein